MPFFRFRPSAADKSTSRKDRAEPGSRAGVANAAMAVAHGADRSKGLSQLTPLDNGRKRAANSVEGEAVTDNDMSSTSLSLETASLCPSIPQIISSPGSAKLTMKKCANKRGDVVYKIMEKQLVASPNTKPASTLQICSSGEKLLLWDEFGQVAAKILRKRCRGRKTSSQCASMFKYKVYSNAAGPPHNGRRKPRQNMQLWADIKGCVRSVPTDESPAASATIRSVFMDIKQHEGTSSAVSRKYSFEYGESTPAAGSTSRHRKKQLGWTIRQLPNHANHTDLEAEEYRSPANTVATSIEEIQERESNDASLSLADNISMVRSDADPALMLCLLAISQQVSSVNE